MSGRGLLNTCSKHGPSCSTSTPKKLKKCAKDRQTVGWGGLEIGFGRAADIGKGIYNPHHKHFSGVFLGPIEL